MTDENIAQVMVVGVIAALVLAARWYGRRIPNWGPVADGVVLPRDSDGAAIVPVGEIWYRRTMGSTRNSMSPKAWITDSGLRFKVFKTGEKPFSAFKRVEAYPALVYGTRLVFVGDGEWLHLKIPDRGAVRAVLRMLPPDLPLSPAALALRGDR